MPAAYSWTLVPDPSATPPDVAAQAQVVARGQSVPNQQKRGLKRPFMRDGARDIATATVDELLASRVGQIIGTFGEMPWRHEEDSKLDRLRNTNNSVMLREFAALYCRDALRAWLPSVALVDVQATRTDRSIDMVLTCQRVSDAGTDRTFTANASISTGR